MGRVKELTLGELKVSMPYVAESTKNRLGIAFLSRFVVTFDFREKSPQIYLKPGKRYSSPDVWDCSGMSVVLDAGKVIVCAVKPGTSSAKAGVRQGDEVWMFGSKRAVDVGLVPLRRALCGAGTIVQLVLRRDDKEHAVSVALPPEKPEVKK